MGQSTFADVPDIPPSIHPRPYLPLYSVHFTAFRTSRPRTSSPVYCFPDFASTDFASGLLLSGLCVHGLRVRFTALRTSRPLYCFLDFASALLLFGLRVHGLRLRFTAFWTSRPVYCFLDFASTDFASTLSLSGLRVHFTAFWTSRPHLLLSGLRVRMYCFPDFASTLHAFRGLRPFTYHFTSSKSQLCYYLMTGGASFHGERRQKRSPGPKKGASHDLWLHPLTEHATKEGQAVSTPFWPTGFPHENPRSKPELLFTTRQSEVKGRPRSHEQWEKSWVN
ncbi:hypothetical protein CDL15_Pgr004919 [Punica granatum]|uniref:Uncharacterized protein n=1 Tax=Punica granatum TaxID=22663 RepID=A0A218XY88_PUNGR|nr:hypothetical protein CDL15_Pgr004919 [Punica granatum]